MITLAVIEDHTVFVDALKFLLTKNAQISCVGSADTVAAGRELVKRTQPDVLLLDIGLPDGDGIDLVPMVLSESPCTRIVVLTARTDDITLMKVVEQGVEGFVNKGCSLDEMLDAVRQVARGQKVMPTEMLLGLMRRVPRDKSVVQHEDTVWERLTPREHEVLTYLAHGKTGEIIANELNIAPLTVRTHIRNLMSKLGVHSRLEAVAFGMRYGLIDQPSL